MRPLSVPELLDVWERGLAARPYERALAIVSAACPEHPLAALARAGIGRRDARLLKLREWAFGAELACVTECPRCHQRLETTHTVAELSAPVVDGDDPEATLTLDGYELRCRCPNSEDLAACAGLDLAMCRRVLLDRCLVETRFQGEVLAIDRLPDHVARRAIETIGRADPQAEILIELSCPDCSHRWSEPFDIASFFWVEIDAWARRLLREVHVLASAYGWTERDILPLSPVRRQIYLSMAQA